MQDAAGRRSHSFLPEEDGEESVRTAKEGRLLRLSALPVLQKVSSMEAEPCIADFY